MRLTQFIQKYNYVQTGFLKTDEVTVEQKCEMPACREKLETVTVPFTFSQNDHCTRSADKMGYNQFFKYEFKYHNQKRKNKAHFKTHISPLWFLRTQSSQNAVL